MTSSGKRNIRVGVQVSNQHAPYPIIRDTVRQLEDLGVDIVFNWDHFFPLSGDRDGLHFEAWTMLAAIAEQTTRVEFGPLVNCNAYRNPDLQADMARTVDQISAHSTGTGRFIFGTGSGWFERDFTEYGYPFGTPGSRLDALSQDLPRIRARWELLNPAPTRQIPILIGGGGEQKTLKIVAQHADIWHSFADPETMMRKIGVLRHWCEEIGRPVGEIEISTGTSIRGFGSTELAELDVYRELGVTLFEVAIDATHDLAVVKKMLAWRDSQQD
ncbi:MAG: LLM class F420-dependent oxidoreductase [Pseudolysinimonas sp.]|uniref:LLM class F420-dependent oxidoreductase n=1 Tax=Pseudolysinimonas sp. TaxID=2680009 RepID=UPI003266710E